jgi:hypothetical protein
LTTTQLTPFVTAQIKPAKFEKTRPDGTIYKPNATDGREFIETWKIENRGEYEDKKRAWVEYFGRQEGARPVAEEESSSAAAPPVGEAVETRAREEAMARLMREDERKGQSWLGRLFRR